MYTKKVQNLHANKYGQRVWENETIYDTEW